MTGSGVEGVECHAGIQWSVHGDEGLTSRRFVP